MKYEKGTFATVPIKLIEGLNPKAQCLFMWLCKFANETGDCFPSYSTLMKVTGIRGRTTLSKQLLILIKNELITKIKRHNPTRPNELTSNKYQINLSTGGSPKIGLPSPKTGLELNPTNSSIIYNPLPLKKYRRLYTVDTGFKSIKDSLTNPD